jgi:uncharacterized protein
MIAQVSAIIDTNRHGEPMRTLLIFIALALIVLIGKRLLQRSRSRATRRELSGNMVQCARCGIFIPQHEALMENDHYYCSAAHRDEDHA